MLSEYIFSTSVGLTVFIMALILGKRPKATSDYILLSWLMLFAINFSAFLIIQSQGLQFSRLQMIVLEASEASIFLHGPILLFYSSSLIRRSFSIQKRDFWHFLPFIACFLILIIPVLLGLDFNQNIRNSLLILKMGSLITYVAIVLKNLYKHRSNVKSIFSNTYMKYLNWLFVLSWGAAIIWLIAVISILLERFTTYTIPQYESFVTNSALSVFLFVIGYFGIRQPTLFQDLVKTNEIKDETLDSEQNSKYQKSGLSREDAQTIHDSLILFVKQEKPFLDPEISLYSLALQLKVQPNHLSQVINSFEKKNFYYFISKYRVEHIKKVIETGEKEHLSLLGIAYESGFNSKTSFNRVFKQIVGETPSQYRSRFKKK